MEEELKKFIYHKNGWMVPQTSVRLKKDPNIKGEKIGTLYLDGKPIQKGPFSLIQAKKKELCKLNGIGPKRASKRFKITY